LTKVSTRLLENFAKNFKKSELLLRLARTLRMKFLCVHLAAVSSHTVNPTLANSSVRSEALELEERLQNICLKL
jgi:hypothetical protein